MAKSKKNKKDAHKPSVKVQDLEAKKDPKGGALFIKFDGVTQMGDGSVLPSIGSISSLKIK